MYLWLSHQWESQEGIKLKTAVRLPLGAVEELITPKLPWLWEVEGIPSFSEVPWRRELRVLADKLIVGEEEGEGGGSL